SKARLPALGRRVHEGRDVVARRRLEFQVCWYQILASDAGADTGRGTLLQLRPSPAWFLHPDGYARRVRKVCRPDGRPAGAFGYQVSHLASLAPLRGDVARTAQIPYLGPR